MPSANGPEPITVSRRDAAATLGVSVSTLDRLTHPRGPIPVKRYGNGPRKAVLYRVADLHAWANDDLAAAKGGAV